ncbi:YggT family protein [Enterobacteriaceae endosymbiont of Donacia sparganii]|uniref:YggT family protein n=1 Tax=Enterobacteriaceae endosymbiont of Donacia sparganii TaxID=2675785 RepID=UPI0014495775|nr:YggT family protein [Enterobacteriaceae endosymbiont of Donacia sparganii]QJC35757.1 hypothetical protein GJT98_01400 [Enterobacteriaceae endosymbiont of Donacia sparganii]
MITIICLCKHLIEIIILIFLIKLWMNFSIENDHYNFFIRFIFFFTKILFKYIKKIIPQINKNESLSLIMMVSLLIFLKYPILILIQKRNLFNYNIFFYIFISMLTLLKTLGYLLFWLINIYLILNILNIKNNNFYNILKIFVNQIFNIIKKFFPNIYNINIFLFITNIILYFLNNLLMDLFPHFWFLI